jgi:hypothetical protein
VWTVPTPEQDLFSGRIARILVFMIWDPKHTLGTALWITGGQWAGKTTVCGTLAERFGLTHYHFDYHAGRGHDDRRVAAQVRRGETPVPEHDFEEMWINHPPRRMADEVLASFAETFRWVLDDLSALTSPVPILADGWGLRPRLVLPVTGAPERMLVLVPTDDFRRRQAAELPRAMRISSSVSDPELGQRNRIERDRLLAEDVVRDARAHGVRVIEVDGSRNAQEMADEVAGHFHPFLPPQPAAAEGTAVRS